MFFPPSGFNSAGSYWAVAAKLPPALGQSVSPVQVNTVEHVKVLFSCGFKGTGSSLLSANSEIA